jgi:CheY-like chemotaxis protein
MASNPAPRLLLVDDIEINLFLLEEALQGMGFDIVWADSGKRALEIAAQEHPEVVLLDVQMPGLDGAETSRRIKELPDAPFMFIALVSGYGEGDTSDVLARSGADRFLSKPYTLKEVRALVNEGLRIARERRASPL